MQAPNSVAFNLASRLLGNLSTKSAPVFSILHEKGLTIVPNGPSVTAPFKDTSCGHSIRQAITKHINTLSIDTGY